MLKIFGYFCINIYKFIFKVLSINNFKNIFQKKIYIQQDLTNNNLKKNDEFYEEETEWGWFIMIDD